MSNPYRHPISTPVPELQGKVSIASKSSPSCAPGEVERALFEGLLSDMEAATAGGMAWIDASEVAEFRRRAKARLAALSPQGLDAKEGGE